MNLKQIWRDGDVQGYKRENPWVVPFFSGVTKCTWAPVSLVVATIIRYYYIIYVGTIIRYYYIMYIGVHVPILVSFTGNSLQTFARLLMSIEDCRQNMVGVLHKLFEFLWTILNILFWWSLSLLILTAQHHFSEVATDSRELQERTDSKDKRGEEEIW